MYLYHLILLATTVAAASTTTTTTPNVPDPGNFEALDRRATTTTEDRVPTSTVNLSTDSTDTTFSASPARVDTSTLPSLSGTVIITASSSAAAVTKTAKGGGSPSAATAKGAKATESASSSSSAGGAAATGLSMPILGMGLLVVLGL